MIDVTRGVRRFSLPAQLAGFVHAAVMFASVTRPNNVPAGGGTVERNDEKVMRQPVSDGLRHSGTFLNVPPTSLPSAAVAWRHAIG